MNTQLSQNSIVIIDSFSLSFCQPVRNHWACIFHELGDIGYNFSKYLWFWGFKVHLLVTLSGYILNNIVTLVLAHDIDIFIAYLGCPSQRGLNEHSNGLLRRNGLPKQMDFTNISQNYLSAIADKRNRIPRKSLNYQSPYQVFLSYLKSLTYIWQFRFLNVSR